MKLKSLAAALLALVILSGCSAPNASQGADQIGDTEQMFAEMMIPHHEQAIEMADMVIERSENPEIIALADEIKLAQEPEIELMQTWAGVHAGHGGHSDMAGMLSEAELDQLRATSGTEFEKLFLEAMIKHHEGALEMLSMLDGTQNSIAQTLREQIDSAQRSEIAKMKELLQNY